MHWGSRAGVRGSAVSLAKAEPLGARVALSLLQGRADQSDDSEDVLRANKFSTTVVFKSYKTQLIRSSEMM